jgi:hypothetical protein
MEIMKVKNKRYKNEKDQVIGSKDGREGTGE